MNPYIGMLFVGQDGEDARIEGIGWDWLVGRDDIGEPSFYAFNSNREMLAWLDEQRR